ncbi:DUF1173 domain-containing protein [Streptomyces sp. NBC_01433]|uniref:DUF1173 family protein n=1 Tax=Streptomyces sp. NBC_01433 TaxID=2903864 RepID=UPI00224F15E8|nr:DUF1173 family protein [Streptomyces sp. NBC_01433]MCX4681354.1 DUF1173 domain-containing protein [Streptomyces sp. NBC_01433]MCX4681708.1 DUF1173 domain-containing protein [Streptomyces sp. NBC_01433]MCX4682430.1 DUF1173 domain-containing protein [Streptomyces sp. NBC_01433]
MTPTNGPGCIQLAGRTVQLAWLREHSTQAAPLFARARAEVGHARCLCRRPALRLVIRCTRAGRYHVAGWPGEGEQHDPTCPFHKLGPGLSGRDRYSTQAIRETDHGVSIRLATPLTSTLAQPATHDAAPEETGDDAGSRRSVGLLGLLHWLWEQARLNVSHPQTGRLTWRTCHARLRQQLRETTINGHGMDEALYVVPPFTHAAADANTAALDAFRARLGRHGTTERRALILGQIKEVAPTPHGVAYRLAHQRTPLYARSALHARAIRSYRHAFGKTAAGHGATRVALFVVERSPKGHLIAVDLAAMLTTAAYIPADSSYEVVMADALAACRRAFIKPLRYDTADAVLPDFVLTDMTPAAYVEVYGIHGREAYDRRKTEKREFYQRQGGQLIEWDVAQPLPALTRSGQHGSRPNA